LTLPLIYRFSLCFSFVTFVYFVLKALNKIINSIYRKNKSAELFFYNLFGLELLEKS